MNENKLVKQAWKNGQKINMIVMFFQYPKPFSWFSYEHFA